MGKIRWFKNEVITMQKMLHDLAQISEGEPYILSVYLDLRPNGEEPGEHPDFVRLRGRLHAIEQTLWPRGAAYEEFRHDVERVNQYIAEELPRDKAGLALVVSHGRQIFFPVSAGTPFSFEVAFSPTPHLFQLARLLDSYEPALVVLVDRQTARLFMTQLGTMHEQEKIASDAATMRQIHFFAGAGIKHYERHFDAHRKTFAREIASAIEQVTQEQHARHIIVIGNQEEIPWIRQALPEHLTSLVLPVALPMEITQTPNEIQHAILPILDQVHREEAQAVADRVIDAVRAHGLGVAGIEATRAQLQHGSVETLVLTDSLTDGEVRNALTRQAIATDATVESIVHHDALDHVEGVGALLRYREAPTRS